MIKKFAVIVFPGSNCDHDAYHILKNTFNVNVDFIWHKESNLDNYDGILIPGGFSYGDYLRTGAIAKFSWHHFLHITKIFDNWFKRIGFGSRV